MNNEAQIRQIVREEIRRAGSAGRFSQNPTQRHIHNDIDSPKISQQNIIPQVRAMGNIEMATDGQTYTLGITFNAIAVQLMGEAIKWETDFTVDDTTTASAGAVYQSSNGFIYQVRTNIAPTTTTMVTWGPGNSGGLANPGSSGTLHKVSGSGDDTINFSNYSGTLLSRAICMGNAQLGPSYYFQPETTSSVATGGPVQKFIQSGVYFATDESGATPASHVLTTEEHILSVEYPSNTIYARATIVNYSPNSIDILVSLQYGWEIIGNWVIT